MGGGYGLHGVGWWGWLSGLLLVVGVVLLVVLAVRLLGGGLTPARATRSARAPRGSRARDILDERYARGELTTEEYRDRLQVLGDGS